MDNDGNNLKAMDVNAAGCNELSRWRYCLNMSVTFILHNQNYDFHSKLKCSLQIIHEVVFNSSFSLKYMLYKSAPPEFAHLW